MTRWSHTCLLMLCSAVGCGYQEAREAEARAREQAIEAHKQEVESQRRLQKQSDQAETARADVEVSRQAAEEPRKLATTQGIAVGQSIPISSMTALFVTKNRDENTGLIQLEFHTCLAGRHRRHTTVTIFADKPTPEVLALTAKIDELLVDHPSLHAWFLLVEASRKDEALKDQLRTTWMEHKLKGVELALTAPRKGWERHGPSKDADVTVVLTRNRRVLFHRAMQSDQLTDDHMTDVVAEIEKLAAK